MYKASLNMGHINKYMTLQYNLIIRNDDMVKRMVNTREFDAVEFYTGRNGMEMMKLAPHPFLNIDLYNRDRGGVYDDNLTVNITTTTLFMLISKLKKIIQGFKVKNLFFTNGGKLGVNKSIAVQLNQYVRTPTKTIKLAYAVVPDEENKEIEYEGIAFMINTVDNFCYMTYHEVEYLLYLLEKIDMTGVALHLINTYILHLVMNSVRKEETQYRPFPVDEKASTPVPETPVYTKINPPKEIPEI